MKSWAWMAEQESRSGMPNQKCPGCGALNDVGIFVSGQRVRCATCNLPFTVRRDDSIVVDPAGVPAGREGVVRRARRAGGAQAPARQRPAIRPHPAVEQQEARERARPRGKAARKPAEQPAGKAAGKADPPKAARPQQTAPGGQELKIPGFELFEVIGKGGMGKVYRARQQSLDRVVAIKVLNEDLAKHKSFIKRFEKETASLAAMSHPNISAIIDRGNVGGIYYFVMEYIDGPSMRQQINRGHMELAECLDLFTTLCKAVAHAHQRGVIHRDLKPENVLFTTDGVLKVVDFGLANILDPERRWEMTRTKVSMGTVNYMAPEQRRDAKHVDHLADVYSLGVMLYELLAGELPLGRFEPPSKFRSEVDPRLDRLVLKMLDFEPERRPQKLELVVATLASLGQPAPKAEQAPPEPAQPEEQGPGEPPADDGPAPPPEPSVPPLSSIKPRGRRRRLPMSLLLLAGGLIALAAGAVAIFTAMMSSDLSSAPGDLVLDLAGQTPRVTKVYPQQVKQIAPASDRTTDGRRTIRFEFKPSRLEALPVRLLGGSWQWEETRGLLVQDTCRNALTINQHPATAAFGQPQPIQGVGLVASFKAGPATWPAPGDDGQPIPMQRYLSEHLKDIHTLAKVDGTDRIGVGFLDDAGKGLLVMVPLSGGSEGQLIRRGEGMERPSQSFEPGEPAGRSQRISFALTDGRIKVELDGRTLVDELAGLPLGFKGRPALACQNARCEFSAVELSVSP